MNIRRVANSIVTRLILLGVVFALGGAVLRYYFLSNYLREDLVKVVSTQQEALANYVARDVDFKIVERQAMLSHLAATLPHKLLHQPAQLRAWLGERQEAQPLFSQGLFVTDATGLTLADYPQRPERAGMRYADRDYLAGALAGKVSVGRPLIGRVVNEPVLPMAAPIKDAQGEVRAIVVGVSALAAPGFLDLLEQTRVGETGGFLLISPRDEIFVAATKPELVLKPTARPGVNPLHDRALKGFRGSGITVNAQGVEEIAAFASVPSTGWFVVARLPTTEAFATVARMQHFILRNTVVVVTVLMLLISGALIILFRPLSRAADHADRMTRGELPLEPLPVARDDEVGHLTAAFNRLLLKLLTSQTELARIAHHDLLTGLPNRLLLADRMQRALARASRRHGRLAVLFIDLDGFKEVNDSLGHEAGDEALIEVARRLAAMVRSTDTLARVGGDEFVIVLGDLPSAIAEAEAAASGVAGKCIAALAPAMELKGGVGNIGLSIGIALGNAQSTMDQLMSAADTAMYQAKQGGRNCYILAPTP